MNCGFHNNLITYKCRLVCDITLVLKEETEMGFAVNLLISKWHSDIAYSFDSIAEYTSGEFICNV